MTRIRVGVAALLAVAVAVLAGVAPAAVAQENASDAAEDAAENATEDGDASAGDVPDEYLGEIADGVYIVDYQFTDGEVAVTWYIAEDAAPVTVQYADVGGSVKGEPGVRTPAVQTDAIVRSGEVTKRYPASDGPAGQITQLSVDGNPVVIEGEGTADTSILTTIRPTPALIVGAVFGVIVTGYVAYSNRKEELEQPIRAHEVLDRL